MSDKKNPKVSGRSTVNLIEISMIQNFPPCCLNRDDLGAPKTCMFGGAIRARISSQCQKRAIRNPGHAEKPNNREAGLFARAMGDHIAVRTKFFPELVKNELQSSAISKKEHTDIVAAVESIARKEKDRATSSGSEPEELDDRARLPQLVLMERNEAKGFVDRLSAMREDKAWSANYKKWLAGKLDKKPLQAFLRELAAAYKSRSVDIALFGRMTTSEAFEDVEAAMQVAHAISTHAVVNEVDYFTAVDDLGRNAAAGHVDEAQFNSACFYRYFSLDWGQLVANLCPPEPDKAQVLEHASWEKEAKPKAEKLAAATLGHFIRAAALSTPSGKQNSFAAHPPPDGILVEAKDCRIPTSYANAFADPVPPNCERGLTRESITRLGQYVHEIDEGYGIHATRMWFSPAGRHKLEWQPPARNGELPKAELIADEKHTFNRLDDLIASLVGLVGFKWAEVKDAGKDNEPEGTS